MKHRNSNNCSASHVDVMRSMQFETWQTVCALTSLQRRRVDAIYWLVPHSFLLWGREHCVLFKYAVCRRRLRLHVKNTHDVLRFPSVVLLRLYFFQDFKLWVRFCCACSWLHAVACWNAAAGSSRRVIFVESLLNEVLIQLEIGKSCCVWCVIQTPRDKSDKKMNSVNGLPIV